MQLNFIQRAVSALIITLFSLILVVGCSGSSDSTTGSGGALASKSSISGNVSSGVSLYQQELPDGGLLAAISRIVIPPAFAAAVAGVEVQLLLNGAVVDSQITDSSGNFLFSNLPSGSYSLRLMMDGQSVGESPAISLDPNTKTELELMLDGSLINMKVDASDDQISGNVESNDSDNSPDDMQSDDDSEDNDSDDESEDDDSEDDNSEDDNSSDNDKPTVS
ncbi:MAG: carboxypeptidase-like regulatory domain-containing protein [Arenicellales bacterium]